MVFVRQPDLDHNLSIFCPENRKMHTECPDTVECRFVDL